MNDKLLWADRHISMIFLYLSVTFIPLATNLPNFPAGERYFLALAVLFSGTYALFLLVIGKFKEQISQLNFLFQFALVVTIITTVRYGINIVNGHNTNFFSFYTVPTLAFYSYFVCVICLRRKCILYNLTFFFCTEYSILLLLFRNKFFLDMGVYRFVGIYANPNICGWFSVCSCMLSLGLLVCKHKKSPRIINIMNVVNALLAGCTVMLTYSRASLLALGVGLTVFIILFVSKGKGKLRRNNVRLMLLLILPLLFLGTILYNCFSISSLDMEEAAVGGVVPGTANAPVSKESHNQAAQERFSLESEGIGSILHNVRIQIWLAYAKNIKDYILIGTEDRVADRPIVRSTVRDSHNTCIQAFFYYGMGGGYCLPYSHIGYFSQTICCV